MENKEKMNNQKQKKLIWKYLEFQRKVRQPKYTRGLNLL